jgi:hypothetical protein
VQTFLQLFALAYLSALFLAGAAPHIVRFRNFRQLIREHGIVPFALAGVVAAAVCGFELLAGVAALLSLGQFAGQRMRMSVLVGTALAGVMFQFYVRRLLRQAGRATWCGCSPLSAPLTRASLAPSAGVVCLSICGLWTVGAPNAHLGWLLALPCLWGLIFAGMTVLYPAAVLHLRGGGEK